MFSSMRIPGFRTPASRTLAIRALVSMGFVAVMAVLATGSDSKSSGSSGSSSGSSSRAGCAPFDKCVDACTLLNSSKGSSWCARNSCCAEQGSLCLKCVDRWR